MINVNVTNDWKELCRLNLETGPYIIHVFDYSENAYYTGLITYIKNGDFKLEEISMSAQLAENALRCYFAIKNDKLMVSCNKESKHKFVINSINLSLS